jgi:hypothetical protein
MLVFTMDKRGYKLPDLFSIEYRAVESTRKINTMRFLRSAPENRGTVTVKFSVRKQTFYGSGKCVRRNGDNLQR